MEMNTKQAVEFSGKSEYWLRTRECQWCGQTVLNSLRYGCGAIWERCDPLKRKFAEESRLTAKERE